MSSVHFTTIFVATVVNSRGKKFSLKILTLWLKIVMTLIKWINYLLRVIQQVSFAHFNVADMAKVKNRYGKSNLFINMIWNCGDQLLHNGIWSMAPAGHFSVQLEIIHNIVARFKWTTLSSRIKLSDSTQFSVSYVLIVVNWYEFTLCSNLLFFIPVI